MSGKELIEKAQKQQIEKIENEVLNFIDTILYLKKGDETEIEKRTKNINHINELLGKIASIDPSRVYQSLDDVDKNIFNASQNKLGYHQ